MSAQACLLKHVCSSNRPFTKAHVSNLKHALCRGVRLHSQEPHIVGMELCCIVSHVSIPKICLKCNALPLIGTLPACDTGVAPLTFHGAGEGDEHDSDSSSDSGNEVDKLRIRMYEQSKLRCAVGRKLIYSYTKLRGPAGRKLSQH
eukprot:scaffold44711_cov21-Tisochrysis_lutea.AAC.5